MSTLPEAVRLLASDPDRAEAICREMIASNANARDAKLVLVEALRRKGDLSGARAEIEPLAASNPD